MAVEGYANNYATTLADVGGITSGAVSLTLTSATGAPTAPFRILVESELILVGARTGTACSSLTRGIEGTTAAAHAQSVAITHVLTAAGLLNSPGPLTTKGDLGSLDASGNAVRLAVGTNGQVATADSTQASGMKWAAAVIDAYATSIPRMTSATAPSGTASASESFATTPPWQAMAAPGLYNGWITNGSALPQWLQYQYSAAKTAIAYGFRPWWADTYPTRTPTAWTFQGSNNGTTWTTLSTITGWAPTSPSEDFVWAIASPASYAYYRLNITANGGDAYAGVGEFLIFTSDTLASGVLTKTNNGVIRLAT